MAAQQSQARCLVNFLFNSQSRAMNFQFGVHLNENIFTQVSLLKLEFFNVAC